MISEYVDLKIKRDGLMQALDAAIMHGETTTFISRVHASIESAEKSMAEWQSVGLKYN
jgi:hypothetical protein